MREYGTSPQHCHLNTVEMTNTIHKLSEELQKIFFLNHEEMRITLLKQCEEMQNTLHKHYKKMQNTLNKHYVDMQNTLLKHYEEMQNTFQNTVRICKTPFSNILTMCKTPFLNTMQRKCKTLFPKKQKCKKKTISRQFEGILITPCINYGWFNTVSICSLCLLYRLSQDPSYLFFGQVVS